MRCNKEVHRSYGDHVVQCQSGLDMKLLQSLFAKLPQCFREEWLAVSTVTPSPLGVPYL